MEKWGEKIGEKTFAAGEKLLRSIEKKSPATAQKLKQLQPGADDAEIIEEVRQVAAADGTIAAQVEETAAALRREFGDVINFGKIAVQNVVQSGGTVHQTNTINF